MIYIFKKDFPPTDYKKGERVDEWQTSPTAVALLLHLGIIEEVKEEEWPEKRDEYCYISELGGVYGGIWMDDDFDNARRDFLGIFKTKEEAEERLKKVREFIKTLK